MARRKKLNKRVAILLGSMGFVLVALVLTVAIRGCGGRSLLDRLFPKDPVALLEKARATHKEKKYPAADRLYREAIQAAIQSDHPRIRECYFDMARMNHEWALAGTGLTKTQQGERYRAAVGLLRKGLNRDPGYLDAQKYLCDMFWTLASRARTRNWADIAHRWTEYITEADKLLKLTPEDDETYFRRGAGKAALSQGMDGQYAKEALADFGKAIELNEDKPIYWLGMVNFLRRLPGRDEEVHEGYQRGLEAMPDEPTILISYADFLRAKGDMPGARERLAEAIKKDPIVGSLALADHHVRANELDEAVAVLQRARKTDRFDARTYIKQARIQTLRGQIDDAVKILRQGLAAVDEAAASQPAEQRPRTTGSRLELNYLLTNVLLDAVERGSPDKDKLLAEIRDRVQRMHALNLRPHYRAKVEGRIALAEGRTDEALGQLEEAYRTWPGFDIKTANLLINIYLRRSLPGKAESIINRLLRIPGQQANVPALMAKARISLMRYRDTDRANRIVARVLQLDPNNADAMNTKLVIASMGGEVPVLPKDLKLSRRTIALMLDRATSLWMDGHRKESVGLVEQLYQRAAKEPLVIGRLANLYRRVDRLEDAEKLLKKALEDLPDNKQLKARLALIRENDPAKQRDLLLKFAEELEPLQRALEKATIWATYGDEQKYFQYLQEAAKIEPNARDVVHRLFRYALSSKDWKLAEDCIARAEKANLDGSGGAYYKARLALAREHLDEAIAACLNALKARPTRKDARVLLGEAYMKKKFYDQAYAEFKMVSQNDPGYAPALVGLAMVTAVQGKVMEHREAVRRAYRLAPQEPYIRERHIAIQDETARPEKLIEQRERILQQRPDDLRNILGLGMLYERVKRYDKARDMYVSFHQKSENKLASARVLCRFYYARRQLQDIDRVMEPLLESWKDKIGVLILYGELLIRVDPKKALALFERAIATDGEDPRGHVSLARFWAVLKQWPKAVESMNRYVGLRPEDIGGVKELVRYAIEAHEYGLAGKRLDEILRDDPTDAVGITLKGAMAMRQGDLKEALRLFTLAIQDKPDYSEPRVYRAQVHLAMGEPNKAKVDLQAAKRLTNRLDVSMQLAAVFVAMGDFDNAELIYREIRAGRRDYVSAIDQLVYIYLRRQKWRELTELIKEAQDLFPQQPKYWMVEARMWEVRDNLVRQVEALAKAVEVAPNAPTSLRVYLETLQKAKQHDKVIDVTLPYLDKPEFTAWVLAMRASSLARLGKGDEAERLLLKAIRDAKPDYIILIAREIGDAYGYAAAAKRFEKHLASQPTSWQAHLVLGVLYAEAKDYPKAAALLTKARGLASEPLAKFLADRHLGAIYYQMRKLPETEQAYLSALKVNPNDVQILNNLAYLYTNDLNQPRKALPYAAGAARRIPSNARVLDTYGWTLAKIGRLVDAERALARAVQLEKPLAASRYHLGWVYEQLGRFDEAQRQYREGFEMVRTKTDNPLYQPLKEGLERVGQKLQPGSAK